MPAESDSGSTAVASDLALDASPTTTHPEPGGPPHRAELPSGPFLLNNLTASKLNLNQTLSLALSVWSAGDNRAALGSGFTRGASESSERHGAMIDALAPSAALGDTVSQPEQIDALLLSGEADCLVVEAPPPGSTDSEAVARAIDKTVNAGVPVFTVSSDSPDSRRFAFYGLHGFSAGMQAGTAVGRWAVEGRILLRKAGVLTGDNEDPLSQQMMEGFIVGITEVLPDIEFVNGPDSVESFGFDPHAVFDRSREWVLAHPDVNIVFHTDSGLESLAGFIAEEALYGHVSAAGMHMSEVVARYIRERAVVVSMVPGLAAQAAAAAEACADFLLRGAYHTGPVAVDPVPVTEDNVDSRDWKSPENL